MPDERSDVVLGRRLSNAERLARAVLLFHRGGPWRASDGLMWVALTGSREPSTKALCDLARRIWSEEERRDV